VEMPRDEGGVYDRIVTAGESLSSQTPAPRSPGMVCTTGRPATLVTSSTLTPSSASSDMPDLAPCRALILAADRMAKASSHST